MHISWGHQLGPLHHQVTVIVQVANCICLQFATCTIMQSATALSLNIYVAYMHVLLYMLSCCAAQNRQEGGDCLHSQPCQIGMGLATQLLELIARRQTLQSLHAAGGSLMHQR
jgi:hypothetical protein